MNDPATPRGPGTTRDLRPYDDATRLLRARPTGAGGRTDDLVGRGLEKRPESPGGDSNKRLIWGIPDNFRAAKPKAIYPLRPDGAVALFDDVPPPYRHNVDVADPPFDRAPGAKPPMSAQDEREIIAFLDTLTDGYLSRADR